MKTKCIGLALSGGSYRALVFHLGVLARLACDNLLEEVSFVSTVSGGSLGTALIYAANDFQWPSSQTYLSKVVPEIRQFLSDHSLVREVRSQLLRKPSAWLRRGGNKLSHVLSTSWGITPSIQRIADHPRWIINATTYETRKNWRYMSRRMGDPDFGYVMNPDIPLAEAVAASAAHPMIGPIMIDTSPFHWVGYVKGSRTETHSIIPPYRKLLLWDGGLYDNLGTEALMKPGSHLRRGIDFLIVSDASTPMSVPKYWLGYPSLRRMTDIMANQVQSLRTRIIMDFLMNEPMKGRYIKLGNHADYILNNAKKERDIISLSSQTLSDKQIEPVRQIRTEDTRMPIDKFDLVFRHGFEVADLTLYAHGSDDDGYGFKGFESI